MTVEKYRIWTDGACRGNPGPGGWAYIVRASDGNEEVCYDYDSSTTNNRMELAAALEALRSIPEGSSVSLFSDSQYVVKGMSEWVAGWQRRNWRKADGKPVLNDDLWKQLVAVAANKQIEWVWVEGHAGQNENERCDVLANRAIDEA
ncbi:MAG: ribonuclease HI [Planctomycetota bacterium]|nr:ribonuclease HI [Planctomycetota bacterium]